MKKRLIGALASIPVIAALAASDSCALSCPYGNINDPYPGLCPRYTDLTGDGICDLSQATIAATTPGTTTSTSDQTSASAGNHSDGANASANTADPGSGQLHIEGTNYHVLPVSIILIGGYFFTHYLFSKGILNQQKHRRIWNILVTAGYVGTGITGVLLILMINLSVRIVLTPSVNFLHAELATVMVIGTIIHIHLYRKSLKKSFKVLFSFKPSENSDKRENRDKAKDSGREKTPGVSKIRDLQ